MSAWASNQITPTRPVVASAEIVPTALDLEHAAHLRRAGRRVDEPGPVVGRRQEVTWPGADAKVLDPEVPGRGDHVDHACNHPLLDK